MGLANGISSLSAAAYAPLTVQTDHATFGTFNEVIRMQGSGFFGDFGGVYMSFFNYPAAYETGRVGSIGLPGGLGAIVHYGVTANGVSEIERIGPNSLTLFSDGNNTPFDIHSGGSLQPLRLYTGSSYGGPGWQVWPNGSTFQGMYFDTGTNANMYFRWNNAGTIGATLVDSTGKWTFGPGIGSISMVNFFSGTTDTSQIALGFSDTYYWGLGRDNAVTGDLLFKDGTTERMRLTTTNGFLGIGGTPTAYLTIFPSSGSLSDADGIVLKHTSATANWLIGVGTPGLTYNTLRIRNTNTSNDMMVFSDNGLIEIGTNINGLSALNGSSNVDQDRLLLYRSSTATSVNSQPADLLIYNAAATTDVLGIISFAFNNNGGSNVVTSSIAGVRGASGGYIGGDLAFFTRGVGDSTQSERMRILSTGDAGVGTTSPSARLHIISTTEQQRTGYDVSNYEKKTVNSTGSISYDLVGTSPLFTFSKGIINTPLTASKIVLTDGSKMLISGTTALQVAAGLTSINNTVALTGQTADIAAANIATVAGLYRVSYSLQDTTADLTAGAVVLTISYTDGAGATTSTATQVLTGTGRQSGDVYIQLASGNATYAITHTGLFGTANYALYITTERLN